MPATSPASWPRRRLQLRSVISATMSIGWAWVAASALIPYFLIGRGRGAGSIEMFGIARTEWLGFHVWSSITIGLITLAHVVLNRRGLSRSYRVVGGGSTRSQTGDRATAPAQRGLALLAAVALVAVIIGGSWAFAANQDPAREGSGRTEAGQEVEAIQGSGEDRNRIPGSGNGYRGGRGAGGG